MFSGYKARFRLVQHRLESHLEAASKVESLIDRSKPENEILATIGTAEKEFRSLEMHIQAAVGDVDSLNQQWSNFYSGLKGDAPQIESEKWEAFVAEEGNIWTTYDAALGALSTIRSNLHELEGLRLSLTKSEVKDEGEDRHEEGEGFGEGDEEEVVHETFFHSSRRSPGGRVPRREFRFSDQGTAPIQLPKLTLPNYDGDLLGFTQWWETFKAAVDDRPIPDMQKLTYLLSVLQGKALELTMGWERKPENYAKIVALLKERFGDKRLLLYRLNIKLERTPLASAKIESVRDTYDRLHRICMQLQQLGQTIENPLLEIAIEKRFPFWVVNGVYEAKMQDPAWTVQKLLETLNRIIYLRETVLHVQVEHSSGASQSRQEKPEVKTEVRGSFAAIRSDRVQGHCTFCDGGKHYSNECPQYIDLESRRSRIVELARCFKCFGRGHFARSCRSPRKCFKCGDSAHHYALCPQPRNSGGGNSSRSGEVTLKGQMHSSGGQPKAHSAAGEADDDGGEETDEQTFSNVSASVTEASEKSKHVYREQQVLLMTADTVAENPSDTKLSCTVPMFLDVGSEIHFISEELVQRLRIKPLRREALSLQVVSATQSMPVSTAVYAVSLRQSDGSYLNIEAYSLKRVVSNLARANPSDARLTDLISPQILIGCSHFWDIVTSIGPKLPSGLRSIETVFGPVLCGRKEFNAFSAHSFAAPSEITLSMRTDLVTHVAAAVPASDSTPFCDLATKSASDSAVLVFCVPATSERLIDIIWQFCKDPTQAKTKILGVRRLLETDELSAPLPITEFPSKARKCEVLHSVMAPFYNMVAIEMAVARDSVCLPQFGSLGRYALQNPPNALRWQRRLLLHTSLLACRAVRHSLG